MSGPTMSRDRQASRVNRREEQDTDAGASSHPVDQADPEGLQRGPGAHAGARAVRVWRSVVVVEMEKAAVPANEQPQSK